MIEEEITRKMVTLSQSFQTQRQARGPFLSPLRSELESLTLDLISERAATEGPLSHPFASIRGRSIPINNKEVGKYLNGATILVTGAAGTVGGALAEAIAGFRPAKILLLDRRPRELNLCHERLAGLRPNLQILKCEADICSLSDLSKVFAEHRPEVVYHLAAQREPGRAEKDVCDTIRTNILGTQNLALLATQFHADRFIYSASARCRFIYENRVYSATKKFAEAIVKMAARDNPTRFSVVRFHHLVENSIVEQVFASQIAKNEPLTVHFPPKTQPCQSLQEAVAMLLNVGVTGTNGDVFAVAREVERFSILDLALYSIKASGKPGTIVFRTPDKSEGYQVSEFAGTRRSPHSRCVMHAFNMVETQNVSVCDELHVEKAEFPGFDREAGQMRIDDVLQFIDRNSSSGEAMKERLYRNLFLFAADIYARAPLELVTASFLQGIHSADPWNLSYLEAHSELLTILLNAICAHDRAEFSTRDRETLPEAVRLAEDTIGDRAAFHDLMNAIRRLRALLSE